MTCNSGFVSRFLTEGPNIYSSAAWLSVRKKSAGSKQIFGMASHHLQGAYWPLGLAHAIVKSDIAFLRWMAGTKEAPRNIKPRNAHKLACRSVSRIDTPIRADAGTGREQSSFVGSLGWRLCVGCRCPLSGRRTRQERGAESVATSHPFQLFARHIRPES
jgi:hypothetical protein